MDLLSKQENDKTLTLTATLMLKIGCYAANDEKGLNENISKFWDLNAVGIKVNLKMTLNLKTIVILSSYQ